jgi:putative protease
MIELLAPASNLEKIRYAISYGADAIFCGGFKFSLRERATNFNHKDLVEAVELVHSFKKKIYVTVNIYPTEYDESEIIAYLKFLDKIKVDAIIVSSMIFIKLAKKYTKLEIHLSTQRSTMNSIECDYWKDLGVNRIVLARELNLEDIALLLENTSIDVETFVHGAMCSGYSGLCQLSLELANRDANMGSCAQCCRWNYNVDQDNPLSLSAKDQSLTKYILDLIRLGVKSLKIEGRIKSTHYIATVTGTYRYIIDTLLWAQEPNYALCDYVLAAVENRSKSDGFVGQNKLDKIIYKDDLMSPNQIYLGDVLETKEGYIKVQVRNYISSTDILEVFTTDYQIVTLGHPKMYDAEMKEITTCNHPMDIIYLESNHKFDEFAFLRKRIETMQY